MVKKSKKSKSKRCSLKKKYKIIKKVKEHHKKKDKEAKKLGLNKRTKVEKDPGIPNDWPFKEQELKALEVRRSKAIEELEEKKAARKERAKKRKLGLLGSDDVPEEGEQADEENKDTGVSGVGTSRDKSDRAFYKDLEKVIDLSDVVLEVLDARDPIGSRCVDMEKMVTRIPEKKLVLVLNKIDLVPREAVEKWLKYFREELPAVAFRCGWMSSKFSKTCLGAETLIKLLKKYTRSHDIKKTITVGIIGLPNVGKTSLINSLKRDGAVPAGSVPGMTRAIQEVHLDKDVKLLDCPGVMLLASGQSHASLALRNCKRVEKLEDPIAPVKEILSLCPQKVLVTLYKIPSFDSVDDFLQKLATVRGKFKKGGVVDVEAVAKIVLHDWNVGKIPYYTMPPSRNQGDLVEETKIVSDLGKEFNVDSVYGAEAAYIGNLKCIDDLVEAVQVPSNPPFLFDQKMLEDGAKQAGENDGSSSMNEDGEDETMEPEEEETGNAKAKSAASKQNEKLYDAEGILNTKQKKAEKKRRKNATKKATSEDAREDDDQSSDEYNFEVDFRRGSSSMNVDGEVAGISAQIPMAG